MRILQPLLLLEAVSAYEFEVFFRGGDENVWTWRDAKNYCQNLKDGWQLVVIDSLHKQSAVEEVFQNAGAENDDAAWIGYTNRDGWGANSADPHDTLDIYGNRAGYLNYAPGQPDNKRGNPDVERGEDCVRMRWKNGEGLWEDALCGRSDTGRATKTRVSRKNSFICEPRPDEDLGSCIPKEAAEIPTDAQYHIEPASTISYNEARTACQGRGFNWDLVVFESDEELQYVKTLINCLPEAFWVGYREYNSKSIDLFGKPSQIVMPWWVNKDNGEEDEPNDPDGECVRMRHGKMNDAVCTRTWSGAMRDGIGMGYVCEKHLTLVPGSEHSNTVVENTCEENPWGIAKFIRRPACPRPAYCEAQSTVVDAWSKQDQNSGRTAYGFAIKISLSAEFKAINKQSGYSLLIRFPDTVKRASFQSWNFNFFNFYNDGKEVLMHSRYFTAPNFDNFDPDLNSFILVVENLNVKTHPQVLAFSGRQKKHFCFDPSMNSNARSNNAVSESTIRELAQEKYGTDITLENVQSFSFNSKGLSRVKAKAKRVNEQL